MKVEVAVIKPGSLVVDEVNRRVLWGSSNVVLIKARELIVVDTGMVGEEGLVLDGLTRAGVDVDDVGVVINTHSHRDHTSNNHLFRHAVIACGLPGVKEAGFRPLGEGLYEVCEGVKVLETPGHSWDHVAVLVEAEEGLVAVAGDAISKRSLAENVESLPIVYVDPEQYIKSKVKLLELADIIIPGHEPPFRNPHKLKP